GAGSRASWGWCDPRSRVTADVVAIGAGVSGLSFANWYAGKGRVIVLERDAEPGGYCKTVARDGFVWDYSGHFFHFKHAEIEAWLRERMPGQRIRVVEKKSFIAHNGRTIDFPFQKNIHQLALDEFIECLHDLYFAAQTPTTEQHSFKD